MEQILKKILKRKKTMKSYRLNEAISDFIKSESKLKNMSQSEFIESLILAAIASKFSSKEKDYEVNYNKLKEWYIES